MGSAGKREERAKAMSGRSRRFSGWKGYELDWNRLLGLCVTMRTVRFLM